MIINIEQILANAMEIKEELISYRRELHSEPELSFKEYKTSSYIQNKLNQFNIPFKVICDTGVIGLIGSGDNCVAIRADMDALPILEETNLPFSSKTSGIMHACGHDFHTTMLLGAAKILKSFENELPGSVKLIFQPGEEKLPGGAKLLIDNGVLDNPAPKAIFGQHVFPEEETGTISMAPGAIMASADEIYINLKGKSSHAAQPHLGGDAIVAASQIILALQTLLTKFKDPTKSAVISITSIHGGTATNTFPDEVRLMGTMRTFDNDIREQLNKKIHETIEALSKIYNVTFEINILKGYPPLINEESAWIAAKLSGEKIFGVENVKNFIPKMWAEDFAYYGQKIPACFWFLGVKPPNTTPMAGLHNSKFDPDENSLPYGAAMLAWTAASALMENENK